MASSTTCKAPPPPLTVRGTHQFEIVGYSLIRDLAAGKFVRSGTFAVGGYQWSVRFYPGGFSAPHRYHASIFIKLMTNNAKAWARFELRLVDHATGLSRSVFRAAAQPVVFDYSVPHKKCKGKRGARAFMARRELEASVYVRDDRLTVECILDVVAGEERVAEAMALCQARMPSPDLSKHLGGLLLNQKQDQAADITLNVRGEVFHAHKVVLAMRSPVFKAQLYGPMKEKETRCVAVDDMQPVVFGAVLHFIYTDVLLLPGDLGDDDLKEMVRHLLEAADCYGMERLKLICESILCRSLDENTVAATLALADQHYCKALEDVCVQFMPLAGSNDGRVHCALLTDQQSSITAASMPWSTTTQQAIQMASSPNTKSTSTTETIHGERRFDIANYSRKQGHGPGTVLTSDTFSVGGLDWAICYYPNVGKDDEAYVSVFVRLVTKDASARALFDLRLVDRATGLPRSVHRSKEPVAFVANEAKKRQRGARAFMARSELAASPYPRDDRLTVECILDVVQKPRLTATTVMSSEIVEPPPSDLWKHLGQLMVTQEGTDVAFNVQGEAFHAHRIVLAARSPVFKVDISVSPPPNQLEDMPAIITITIHDMRPLVFKALLHFIYTDTLPSLDDLGVDEYQELVRDLLKAAGRYAMERLEQICTLTLRKVLDAKTVAAALAFAGRHHHCEALGDACVQFMPSAGFEG